MCLYFWIILKIIANVSFYTYAIDLYIPYLFEKRLKPRIFTVTRIMLIIFGKIVHVSHTIYFPILSKSVKEQLPRKNFIFTENF